MVEMIVEEFFWRGVSNAMKQGTKALIAPIHQSVTDKGHLAPNCPWSKENKGMRLCGFGLPGQLFYSIHVPIEEEEKIKSPLTAVMTIIQGKGSVSKVTTELQYLINSTWD